MPCRSTIPSGATVALTGPSGSGKSTLLHLMGAMDRAYAGTVVVDDVDLASLTAWPAGRVPRTVGFVFQRFHLLPALNVLDNVRAPLLPVADAVRQAGPRSGAARTVGLAGRERALPSPCCRR